MKKKGILKKILGTFAALAMTVGVVSASAVPVKADNSVTVTINPAPSGGANDNGQNANRPNNSTGYPSYTYYALMWASVGEGNRVSYYVDKEDLAYALDQLKIGTDDLFTVSPTPTETGHTNDGHWNVVVNSPTDTSKSSFSGEEIANALYTIVKDKTEDNLSAVTEANGTVAKDASSKTFTLSNNAYVLVVSSLGTKLVADTVQSKTIQEKNVYPTSSKTQSKTLSGDYSNTPLSAEIGETIYYHLDITIPATVNKSIKVVDTISSGLSMNTNVSYVTTHNSTPVTVNWENNSPVPDENGNKQYTFTLNDSTISQLTTQMQQNNVTFTTLTVSYSAVVNNNAATVDPDTNKAHIEYDEYKTPDSEVNVYTYKFNLMKYDAADTGSRTQLPGAKFELHKGDQRVLVKLVPIDNEGEGNHYQYRVATTADEIGSVSDFTTISGKNIEIFGLDKNSTYYLRETEAPSGFNRLVDDVQVNYDNTGNGSEKLAGGTDGFEVQNPVLNVANHQGSVLPSTGGIGTTIFYVAGGAIIICAAVLLIARRKRNA